MAINLVTGLPGHGKTLWTLVWLKALAALEGRPVFHNDIPALSIEGWQVQKADEWHDLPPNSYMLIDEAQKVFPIRPRSSAVPVHVSELETHRHKGLDLYLITQHPQLIDTHVRKLVDRHFHVVRTFGMKRATVYEFPTGVQDSPEKNKGKAGVVRHEWAYPKKAFGWYKSAEVHTVKSRVPLRVWLYALSFLLIPLLVWWCFQRLWVQHGLGDKGAAAQAASAPVSAASVPRRVQREAAAVLTREEYIARFQPRLLGLAFTAPVYDELTRPVEAPYPSVCAYSPDFPCRCWSQRGFKLEVPESLCKQLAREPMDPYWLRRGPLGFERGQVSDVSGVSPAASAPPVLQASVQ
jgi:zona occludens toxin (predicted ATPase)